MFFLYLDCVIISKILFGIFAYYFEFSAMSFCYKLDVTDKLAIEHT